MSQIRFKPGRFRDDAVKMPGSTMSYADYDFSSAQLVAMVIYGTDEHVVRQSKGFEFRLDGHNDWIMKWDAATKEYVVAHRGGLDDELYTALRRVLIWRLGYEDVPQTNEEE